MTPTKIILGCAVVVTLLFFVLSSSSPEVVAEHYMFENYGYFGFYLVGIAIVWVPAGFVVLIYSAFDDKSDYQKEASQ